MAKQSAVLTRIRKICLSLPDTKETETWGKPHFRVGEKIFTGVGERDGQPVVGFKLKMEHASARVRDPRFTPAPYVGHKGWVSMDASRIDDWDDVRSLIFESYMLIAPKRSLAKMGAPISSQASARRTPKRVSAANSTSRRTRRKAKR